MFRQLSSGDDFGYCMLQQRRLLPLCLWIPFVGLIVGLFKLCSRHISGQLGGDGVLRRVPSGIVFGRCEYQ